MRIENIKVKITVSIPFDKPDINGNVYTKEAVENAVNHLHKNLPIIFSDNVNTSDGENKYMEKCIGATTGDSHIVTWDFENQVCKVIVDGTVFYGGTECIVNEIKDGKVSDFEIISIGLSR